MEKKNILRIIFKEIYKWYVIVDSLIYVKYSFYLVICFLLSIYIVIYYVFLGIVFFIFVCDILMLSIGDFFDGFMLDCFLYFVINKLRYLID